MVLLQFQSVHSSETSEPVQQQWIELSVSVISKHTPLRQSHWLSTQPWPPQYTHSKQQVWGWFANGQLHKSSIQKLLLVLSLV